MIRRILPLLLVVLLVACSGKEQKIEKKGSSGKTLEMLIVADRNVYSGETKSIIDSLFKAPQPGLPSYEPLFDVVNIPTTSFKNTEMFRVHRNVIICDVNPENPNKVYIHIDAWSAPQIIFEFAVKDLPALDSMLLKYHAQMLQELYRAEHRRLIKAFKAQSGYDLQKAIQEQFGFHLMFSDEFAMANVANPTPDFAWVRKEAKDFSIGVLIQVTPYESKSQFEQANILNQLDSMMHRVEGPADGSYMGLERRLDFYTQLSDMPQSSYCVETRGCWRLFGDFMGGAFVSYSMLSPDNKQLITLCAYTYSPRFPKRDYLMQVEGICHSISFKTSK